MPTLGVSRLAAVPGQHRDGLPYMRSSPLLIAASICSTVGRTAAACVEESKLQVTYRPLTFNDDNNNDYSKRVANAMFLAASPTSKPACPDRPITDVGVDRLGVRLGDVGGLGFVGTSPQVFESFITLLFNPPGDGPDDADMAGIAKTSGIPSQVVDRIAAKDTGVDGVAMADANDRLLTSQRGHQMVSTFRRCTTPCITPLSILLTGTGSTT